MKYEIEKKYEYLKDFVLQIQKHFRMEKSYIHKERNEVKELDHSGKIIVVKSFQVLSMPRRFIYTFLQKSKAKRSFLYSQKLKNFAPKPIAYVEFFRWKLLEESYYLCEKFDFDFTIREVLFDENFYDRENILKQFAIFTYNLHNNGIYHLDYSPGNILIKKDKKNYTFSVVDVNRMAFFKPNLTQRMKNFERLTRSEQDLEIIAKEYAKVSEEDGEDCMRLIKYYSKKHTYIFNFKRKIRGKETI